MDQNASQWQIASEVLTGDTLAKETVPASKLKLDSTSLGVDGENDALTITQVSAGLITSGVLQSQDYKAHTSGFSIDTQDQAEFNNAHIRGKLESSRIEGSVLVAPTTIIPCEKDDHNKTDGFYSLDESRPLIPLERTPDNAVKTITLGPLVIPNDRVSRRFGDGANVVIVAKF